MVSCRFVSCVVFCVFSKWVVVGLVCISCLFMVSNIVLDDSWDSVLKLVLCSLVIVFVMVVIGCCVVLECGVMFVGEVLVCVGRNWVMGNVMV